MLARNISLATLLSVLSLASPATGQEGVVLKYQFSKEEPLIYRSTTEMNQTMQLGGQTYESKFTQSDVNTQSLVEVTPEGNLKLKHLNNRLSIKADMGPAGTYAFDSESSEREKGTALSNELNPIYETLSGVEYFITITPQGKVEKLDGYKEILENILKDHPLAAQFTGGGSEQAQKDSLAEVFFLLNDKPVKEGDTWEVPFQLEMAKLGKAEGKRVYKYEGPANKDGDKVVKLSVSMEASFDFDLKMEGATITGNIGTESSKGEIRFDLEKGQVVSATLEYTLAGTINTMIGERTLKTTLKQTQKRSTQRLAALPN
jgi:Family of unknown function (DUF6263)